MRILVRSFELVMAIFWGVVVTVLWVLFWLVIGICVIRMQGI